MYRPAVSSAFCNVVIPWLSFDHGEQIFEKLTRLIKTFFLNKGLIAINRDEEYRPAFLVDNMGDKRYILAKLLSGNRIALAFLIWNTKVII